MTVPTPADQRRSHLIAAHYYDVGLTPLAVTIGGVDMTAAGSLSTEEIQKLLDGGILKSFEVTFRLLKSDFDAIGAPSVPGIGALITAAGVDFMVTRVFGHEGNHPIYSFRASRDVER
jgi:hypothetical protein